MKKNIALYAIIIVSVIGLIVLIKHLNSPNNQLQQELKQENLEVGPLEIEEEFTGPNTNYVRSPETNIEELNLNFE